jgi:glutamyl-tRNA synthetase, bacterial family
MKEIRTRFAPSPTGFMHIGNLRTALFEYFVAKKENGKFILRVEDTDQERKVEGAIDFIYDTLKLCNIEIDEGPGNPGSYGPYLQSERLNLYKEYALKLIDLGKAYYCFCSEDRLDGLRDQAEKEKRAFMYDRHCYNLSKEEIDKKLENNEPYVIRQLMNNEGTSTYEDLVYGTISVDNSVLEDQILLKSDGYPTYNFANVIDDHLMDITHIIRGNEYIMSTAKYNQLYEAFEWDKPIYIHVPMVLGEDGQKLSKRNGDASFMDLYNEGYLPEAIVNYLILLGWSPNDNQEVFSISELEKVFDPRRIGKSSSQYDIKKLQWFNSIYIKKLDISKLMEITIPHLENAYDISKKDKVWLEHLIRIYQGHISYGKEIVEVTDLFFKDDITLDEECSSFMNEEGVSDTINAFKNEIENISSWTVDNINLAINNVKEKTGVKGKMLYMPIRIKISGQMHGPELPDTIYLLGKEIVLNRLNK